MILSPVRGLLFHPFAKLFHLRIAIYSGSGSGISDYGVAMYGVVSILSILLISIITTSIVQFSRFHLTSHAFLSESIMEFGIGLVSTAMYFAGRETFGGIFVALNAAWSMALMGYAISVRRKVARGMIGEMRRGNDLGCELVMVDMSTSAVAGDNPGEGWEK
jgi:hypothetical protein